MNRLFNSPPSFHYEHLASIQGPRIHVISYEGGPVNQFSIAVSVDFGSKHLSCIDEAGELKSLPIGLAHFMEHFLFWLCYDDVLDPLSMKYASQPNAVVTYDKTVWGIQGAGVTKGIVFPPVADEAQIRAGVYDITQRLFEILSKEPPQDKIKALITRTIQDVKLEIGYRHNHGLYPKKLELLSALYREAPVRYDILGTSESLDEITPMHVSLALRLIRTNIQSVIVQGYNLSDESILEIKEALLLLIANQTPVAKVKPISPRIESLEVNKISSGVRYSSGYQSDGILGIKLPPLQESFSAGEELKRMFLINYLVLNYIHQPVNGIISPQFRTYIIAGSITDPWFFWEKRGLYKVMNDLKVALVRKFEEYREFFDVTTELAVARAIGHPYRLMKLCHAADLYNYDLNELYETFARLRAEDLDKLTREVRDTTGNASLVYTQSLD